MSNGHPAFLQVLEEIRLQHLSKGHDYGTNKDTFANIRAAQEFGIAPWLGAVLRANDKMARIKAHCEKGSLKNESLEDSLKDAANYFIIALVLFREAYDIESLANPISQLSNIMAGETP